MSDEMIVTLAGVALIIFVLWFFLGGSRQQGNDHSHH
jgi:plastocyanin domain-containing protein